MTEQAETQTVTQTETQTEKLSYFSFGSNMLQSRIRLSNPSAVRVAIGKLKDHRLDFTIITPRWSGCSATIVPHEGYTVWGAIWEIDKDQLANLDLQEVATSTDLYARKDVDIELADGTNRSCIVYYHRQYPNFVEFANFPTDRLPSLGYLKTIIQGAEESNLPAYYIDLLKSIPTNGYEGEVHYELM